MRVHTHVHTHTQIAQAIADRKQAEEVNSRLSRMREDEGKFKEELHQRRKAALQVCVAMTTSLR